MFFGFRAPIVEQLTDRVSSGKPSGVDSGAEGGFPVAGNREKRIPSGWESAEEVFPATGNGEQAISGDRKSAEKAFPVDGNCEKPISGDRKPFGKHFR